MNNTTETDCVRIGIGSRAVIALGDNKVVSVTIGGTHESDPDNGIISSDSPLAKALLGMSEGESTTYEVATQKLSARVIRIHYGNRSRK